MVIITGANSFVGQYLVPLVLEYFKTNELLCLTTKGNTVIEIAGKKIFREQKVKMLDVNLVNGENLDKIPKQPELIIHLAANTDTSTPDHRVNDLGTLNLLKAVGKLNPKCHIIYTSTTVSMSGRLDCSKPITEGHKLYPTNEYGRSKARAENILTQYAKKDKFRLTIVRLNTIYGGDPREYKMFKVLKKNILKGSLSTRLNWPGKTSIIHVRDAALILLKLSQKKPYPGKPKLYIVCGESLTLPEIVNIMHQKMKISYKPIYIPNYIWKILSITRQIIPKIEKVIPLNLYNPLWRFSLLIDDVIYCDNSKILKTFPSWKPIKFIDGVKDELD